MKTLADLINGYRQNKHSFASKMVTAFSLVSALMFGMVNLAQAAGVEDITDCTKEISTPGPHRLAVNCDRGISITASDIQLDLDRHTILGAGCDSKGTVGISVTGSNVHISNGSVKAFY
jgi:hypothetical protein